MSYQSADPKCPKKKSADLKGTVSSEFSTSVDKIKTKVTTKQAKKRKNKKKHAYSDRHIDTPLARSPAHYLLPH